MSSFALVTGASNGIGKSIAFSLARRKYNLLLVARSESRLKEIADSLSKTYLVEVSYLALDLSEAGSAQKVKDWCDKNSYHVSILVNNAGYGLWGDFDRLSLHDQMNMLQLNVITLVELTYHLLPVMKQEKAAYILNVSSTAAYQAVPTLALYSASKAFVLSFTRALRFELKNAVSVSCLSPGPVNTNFIDRAGLSSMKAKAEKFGMQPDEVAEIALKGMFEHKAEIIPGLLNVLSAAFTRVLPKKLVEKVAAGLYKK